MAEDVDNGVGRVQDVGVIGEIVDGDEGGIHCGRDEGAMWLETGGSCSTALVLICRI
jgi:hypothetical protein